MFIDEADIEVEGGRGGDGCVSFRREKYRPKGGPDGGSGGRGGDVVVEASGSRGTLQEFRRKRHFRAGRGARGGPQDRKGAEGGDAVVLVPPGTVVYIAGRAVADLVDPGMRFAVAGGGRGGRGNASLAREAGPLPGFAELGEPGERLDVHLELKLVADVAIVGLPNAGKSTLISRISMARPRIADYPFTTVEPNLGVVKGDERDLVVTDVPGLVEGAHRGKGMGIGFLRHIERASIICYLLDMSYEALAPPVEALGTLEDELGRFNPALLERVRVAVANKMDLRPDGASLEAVRGECRRLGLPLFEISAVTGEGVVPLLRGLEAMVCEVESAPVRRGPRVVYDEAPDDRAISVRRAAGRFVVEGRVVERIVLMTDMNNDEARTRMSARLRRAGVDELLEKNGALQGDEVEIAGTVFEYVPEPGPGGPGGGPAEGVGEERA